MLHISTEFYYVQVSVDAGNEAVIYGAPKPKWQPVLCLQDQGEGQNQRMWDQSPRSLQILAVILPSK